MPQSGRSLRTAKSVVQPIAQARHVCQPLEQGFLQTVLQAPFIHNGGQVDKGSKGTCNDTKGPIRSISSSRSVDL
jgi:hypothetical protein